MRAPCGAAHSVACPTVRWLREGSLESKRILSRFSALGSPGHPCGARPAALRGTPLRGPPAGWLTPLPGGCESAARLSCWLHTPRPSDPTGTHVSCDTVTRGRVWSRGSGRRAAQSLCWPCDLGRAVEGSCLAFFSCLRGRIPASLDCSEDHPDNVRKRSGIKRGLVSMNSNSST